MRTVLLFLPLSLSILAGSELPRPSGRYPVGRTSMSWTDRSRAEIITDTPDDNRELMTYIWYPAANASGVSGPYWPGVEHIAGTAVAGQLSNLFGPVWADIAAAKLRSHSLDNARVGASGPLPILVFSPGAGSTSLAYTTQMEELASHGYVVVGVEHTFDAPAVVFPDGRVVASDNAYWSRLRNQLQDDEAFEKRVTEMSAADIVFVVGKFIEVAKDRSSPFFSRLDATRIGVFGHSRGGRDAARACQLDPRIKACLSEDGSFSWQPFWLDPGGHSMNQPFMMLDHLDPELPDDPKCEMLLRESLS
jgi:predicted dienelactone hydrolase